MGRVYDLQAWKRVRREQLVREPLCRHCKARGIIRPAHHVDHIQTIASGGDWFDADNLQSLCAACHSVKTLGDKGQPVRMGCGVDGYPIDQNSHWNL